ncbi:MAG: (E)-4-hydroxy-3-methylbut-2-enyl-diphosphate synthase, partial [Deltaproteobacteria bacterium]|nr:(E)-4-hydroxy-3-methylbut-2-enyl-diphosphate synthase [Deltaproteobacteria bacterium]
MAPSYIENPFVPRRRTTREVLVGDVGIGGSNPIRIQSMTTTDTRDTQGTADQTELLASVGCEIVRVTAPSLTDAENLAAIRKELDRRKVHVPLVADIHFTPNAAMIAAEHVEKIRINPGNFADKKKFAVLEYTDAAYAEEIERVAEKFRPLVQRCKELGRAMRIGTNHGSLSDRIMNRFGDTPAGMVESALEFLDICEGEGFHNIVFSMKSSNTQVAVQAYRLLAIRLAERAPSKPSYPFHVGVTEAGDGEDGRIKSAIGIGALLIDGIGDTIRVSLTEPPEEEVPVASAIAEIGSENWETTAKAGDPGAPFTPDPSAHNRRVTRSACSAPAEIGG